MMGFQSPYFNPYGFMQQNTAQPPVPPVQVVRVSGENGAKAYNMGANSSALLLDESGTIVWLVTTDGASYKTVSAYDITPHKTTPAPDVTNIENRLQTVEKKIEEMMNNGNSKRTAPTGKNKSDDGEN